MTDSTPHSVENMLAHAKWVRRLAWSLVRDEHMADDLAQEAWRVAVESPPQVRVSVRGWFSGVLRNLALHTQRTNDNRQRRELEAARNERLPSTLDALAVTSTQRMLVEAVGNLAEPYRSTLLMRYFDDLSPRVIAKRVSVPTRTVHTRLARGKRLLREQLQDTHVDGRSAWTGLLALTAPAGTPATATMGTLLMPTYFKLAGAVVAIVAGVYFALQTAGAPDESAETPVTAGLDESTVARGTAQSADQTKPQREPAPSAADANTPGAKEGTAAGIMVRGRVFDSDGRSLQGARLRYVTSSGENSADETSASAGGWFELEGVTRAGRVEIADPGWVTVRSALIRPDNRSAQPVVVAARGVRVAGRVVDESGRNLKEATVALRMPVAFGGRFDAVMDFSIEKDFATRSGGDGTFDLGLVPVVRKSALIAHRDGYVTFEGTSLRADDENMWITLRRPSVVDGTLTGRVEDTNGDPVADARVSYGLRMTRSDETGRFQFDLEDREALRFEPGSELPSRLLAMKRGHLPARLDIARKDGELDYPEGIVLRLGGAPKRIRGTVVGADDKPRVGARVFVGNPLLFGISDMKPLILENLLAGSDEDWHYVLSDENGNFELGGLMNRSYDVVALDADSLSRGERPGVAVGTEDVTIQLDEKARWSTIEGRVLTESGEPVVGAEIGVMAFAMNVEYAGQGLIRRGAEGPETSTDEDGRFRLVNISHNVQAVRAGGDRIVHKFHQLGDSARAKPAIDGIELVTRYRTHLQVELADPSEADSFSVFDENDDWLPLHLYQAKGGRISLPRMKLSEGKSDMLVIPETAVTLVLYRKDEMVRRIPIRIRAGTVNRIRR